MAPVVRAVRLVATALLVLTATVNQTVACMIFVPADAEFWAANATTIVDATVVAVERQPLSKPGTTQEGFQGPSTWVLTLKVHKTQRGTPSALRLVATRFANTTTVDERFVRGIVGKRREFALVGFDAGATSVFLPAGQEIDFPPEDFRLPAHDGFHVRDARGQPIEELWEGICQSLPIFRRGTFGN
jgi:hypothetical protein